MKRLLIALGIVVSIVLLPWSAPPAAAAGARIKLLNRPPGGRLELGVGESYTFEIEVKSGEPFILAMAMTDAYYPGRGVFWHGNDAAHQGTSATLYLTMTGKNSTADLPAVCDWPEPGVCWPEGVAPVSIVAGVRYPGGLIISERFDFGVVVP